MEQTVESPDFWSSSSTWLHQRTASLVVVFVHVSLNKFDVIVLHPVSHSSFMSSKQVWDADRWQVKVVTVAAGRQNKGFLKQVYEKQVFRVLHRYLSMQWDRMAAHSADDWKRERWMYQQRCHRFQFRRLEFGFFFTFIKAVKQRIIQRCCWAIKISVNENKETQNRKVS